MLDSCLIPLYGMLKVPSSYGREDSLLYARNKTLLMVVNMLMDSELRLDTSIS